MILITISILLLIAMLLIFKLKNEKHYVLPNGYVIWLENGTVSFGKEYDVQSITIIPNGVENIFNNNDYILVERKTDNEVNSIYYIFDLKNKKYYEIFNEKEFEEKCTEFNIEKIKWNNAKKYVKESEK